MDTHSRTCELTPWLQRLALPLLAVLLATGCVTAPHAQPSGPTHGQVYGSNERVIEPPGRVGKIGLLAGEVTLSDFRSGETEAASLNWPVTSGHRLTTGRGARAEVRVGSLALRMDGDSIVDFNRIDDELIQVVVQAGSVALRTRNRELLREIDVLTPRERIMLEDVGRYRVDVDRVAGRTAVTTFVGQARITSNSGRMVFAVQSGQRGEISSAPSVSFQLVQPANDVFDDWVAARDRRDDVVASSQYVSRETTGVEVLDEYGSWRTVPSYGTVWFPSAVPVGWAPYRYGRWAYVAPWGWTWIDDAPWGFAPFHYGRWVHVGGVWGWYPGVYVARPVYAPALVGWYGGSGVSVSITVGQPVGWFPLGYGEVYIPPWHYSRRYITGVNVPHVRHIHNVNVINPPPRYVYQAPGTATWAPSDAVVRQKPIQRVVRDVPPELVRAPAVVAPPVQVPNGFAKRTVPVGSGENIIVRTPAVPQGQIAPVAPGSGERVGAPKFARPETAVPGVAPAAPAARPSEPEVVRIPKTITPDSRPSDWPQGDARTPAVRGPEVRTMPVQPPVVNPATPPRPVEPVTRPKFPTVNGDGPPQQRPPMPAPRVEMPAPPVQVAPPARMAAPAPTAPPPQVAPPARVAPPAAPVHQPGPPQGGPKVTVPSDGGGAPRGKFREN